MTLPDRHLALKGAAVFLLAAVAALLFIFSRSAPPEARPDPQQELRRLAPAADRAVDSVLRAFALGTVSVRRVAIAQSGLQRIEKRIDVPPEFSSVQLNHALNGPVRELGGRVVASENLKERLVTLHVELGGVIVETVVLRTAPASALERPQARRRRS